MQSKDSNEILRKEEISEGLGRHFEPSQESVIEGLRKIYGVRQTVTSNL